MQRVETITPYEAGKLIGKNAEYIRAGLRANRFNFGSAVQSKTGRWNYNIIKSKFLDYAGVERRNTNEKKTRSE